MYVRGSGGRVAAGHKDGEGDTNDETTVHEVRWRVHAALLGCHWIPKRSLQARQGHLHGTGHPVRLDHRHGARQVEEIIEVPTDVRRLDEASAEELEVLFELSALDA